MLLVGHSFGSILGVQIVKQRPDLFYAYVGTGQAIGWKTFARRSELTVSRLRDLAKTAGNDAALRDLSAIESLPFNNPEKAAVIRKWSGTLHLPSLQSMNRPLVIPPPFMPEFSVADWFYFILGRGFSTLKLAPSVSQSDLTELGLEFRVPIFFFEGAFDFVTPMEPVEQYFENISAPHKELVVFDGADHFLPLDRPTEFLQELRARVRPLAVREEQDVTASAQSPRLRR
jgi:pimeloyl-ACP methyl ester carboxylesterase